MRFIATLAALVFLAAPLAAHSSKQDLRVLYVGGSANWQDEYFANDEARLKDVSRRTASFAELLGRYFTTVKTLPAAEYRQEDSAGYDVTVIDGTPSPRETPPDPATPARYFTEDFDRPVVFIAELGDKLGARIGLKLDNYCLCLDAQAHSLRAGHPIFHGPFPVKLTMAEEPTPKDAFLYEYYRDTPTPKTLPMWRVQTKGYRTDPHFRIGMVARPWGFEDSPEAEYISSGVCQKSLDAVALGRHGNFFGWGFSAAPEFMTSEAQAVFANTVFYMAQFKGKGVIARKYDQQRATKHWVRELKYIATRKAYDTQLELNRSHDKYMAALAEAARKRQAQGEKLSRMEQISLNYRPAPEQSFEEYLKSRYPELFGRFGTDTEAYRRYYDGNFDSFYSEPQFYKLTVDEDVRSLGIPNTEPRLLDRAIGLWEKGEDAARARRILTRYTLLDYSSPAHWRAWYERNKERLFFTQAGGFVFMVDSRERGVEGNDYARRKAAVTRDIDPAATGELNPVSVAAGLVEEGGRKMLVVKFRIHPGFHIYSHVGPEDAFTETQLVFTLPQGYSIAGELQSPPFRPYGDDAKIGIYESEVTFMQPVSGAGGGIAKIGVTYQCCNPRMCLPPAKLELQVTLD